jgi:hypothetical protein
VFLVVHDLSSVAEGDPAEDSVPTSVSHLGHYQLRSKQIEKALAHLSVHAEERDRFFEDELDAGFGEWMLEEEFALDLPYFISIDHLVEFVVVRGVDFFKSLQNLFDVPAIGVVWRCAFADFSHDEDILGQSLDRFDEIVFKVELTIFGVGARFVHEGYVLFACCELLQKLVADAVVVEVFKVEFEEVDFFLDAVEDNPVMAVVLDLFEDAGEEEFVQLADLVDVRKQHACLFLADYFAFEETSSEVGYH